MVLVKIWPFFQHFFQALLVWKMSFTTFQNEKTPFKALKTRSSNCLKIFIFPKGLTHGFDPNMSIFPTFFFQAILVRKMTFTIFQNEKTRFQAIKTTSSKCRKIGVFPKGLTDGFGPKVAILRIFFFLGNVGLENIFYDIIERRNAFLGYKNKQFKKSKN